MDPGRHLAVVRAWLPLLVLSVVLGGASAFALSSVATKIYEAEATLIVGQSLSAANSDYSQLLASQRLSATYASVATKRPLLDNVIKQLGLPGTSEALAKRVQAKAQLESTLLTITAQDESPAQAAAIANALADQLILASPALQGRQEDVQKSVDAHLNATQDLINSTQAKVERLTNLRSRIPAQDADLERLQSQLIQLHSTYAALLSTDASLLAFTSPNLSNRITLVEPAVPPSSPVSPRPLLNAVLAATIALLVAAAIAFSVESLNDSVRDSEDVEEVAGLATLGGIGRMRGGGRREPYRLATLLYPRSSKAEGYRTLRSNIEFSALDAPIRSLLVTSAVPGEGKTVTAANLAVVFAQAGRRVLLVDANLRKPGVDAIFNLGNAQGLTTLIRGDETSLEAVAQETQVEHLQVVTTGPLPPNPAELLGSQRMHAILNQAKTEHDLVILDSPPLQVVTDAAILSSFTDGTLLVIDARHTRRAAIRQAREALAKADARVLGAVLNRLPDRKYSDDHDYYGRAYGLADATPDPGRRTEKSEAAP